MAKKQDKATETKADDGVTATESTAAVAEIVERDEKPAEAAVSPGLLAKLQTELDTLREQNSNLTRDLKLETTRAAKLAKELDEACAIETPATHKILFSGKLQDAAEEQFKKRFCDWDRLTVIYDVPA